MKQRAVFGKRCLLQSTLCVRAPSIHGYYVVLSSSCARWSCGVGDITEKLRLTSMVPKSIHTHKYTRPRRPIKPILIPNQKTRKGVTFPSQCRSPSPPPANKQTNKPPQFFFLASPTQTIHLPGTPLSSNLPLTAFSCGP